MIALVLSGCTTETYQGDTSGKLTCVGYCELDVENRTQTTKTTEPNGKVVEESEQARGMRTQ